MSDIFISYSQRDYARVKPLVEALEAQNWTVWWDPNLLPGETFRQAILKALTEACCMIVLWSQHSVESHFVLDEAHRGLKRGILIQAVMDEVEIPLGFGQYQVANFSRGDVVAGPEFRKLIRGVSNILGQQTASVPEPKGSAGRKAHRVNPKDGLNYVWIPPGKFMMGCSPGDAECYDNEKPLREITISRGFWMGQTPVTQEAYERVMGKNPSHFKGPRLPVESVTWEEAGEYARIVEMRLPTEAEWEYAARAGTREARYAHLETIAWYGENSGQTTHEVGQKLPNAWGLHDMLGNVWEWTADQYPGTEFRVLRGGSWSSPPFIVRASLPFRDLPGGRDFVIGFRCVGEIP